MTEGVEQLQQVEAECIAKFRQRAQQIRAQHPELTAQVAFARAVEALPKTAERYQYIRHRLLMSGIAALPLR
jgi:hypothetical protein